MAQQSRAALFGSHYHDWCCNKNKTPVLVQRRLAFLSPPRVDEISRHLEQTRNAQARVCAVASQVKAVQSRWPVELKRGLEAQADSVDPRVKCPCCREYLATAVRNNEPIKVLPVYHDPDVVFDSTTWTTTATEHVAFHLTDLSPEQIRKKLDAVYYFASPENWTEGATLFRDADNEPFFQASTPGYMDKGTFYPATAAVGPIDPLEPWQKPGGVLEEKADWDWNSDNTSTSTVILEIMNYQLYADGSKEGLKYNYRLHHCVECEIGSVRYADIIDVDGGSYDASYDHDTGSLVVIGEKSLHFTTTRGSRDEDLMALLNLLSPALIGMLMRELVHEGTIKVLNDPRVPDSAMLQARHVALGTVLEERHRPPSLPPSRITLVPGIPRPANRSLSA